ncbi:MAG: hypothetical protein H6Q05_1300 [Acidobacteria bacterium]|nr:hypothetical protein [Acidobacteriota bacterium]
MKMIRFVPAMLIVILASACVPLASLNPLWDESHLVPLPALEGRWASEDGDNALAFVQAEKTKYHLTLSNKEGTSQFEVRAVMIDKRTYLDFFPDEKSLEKRWAGEAYLPVIPTHFFARVSFRGDVMQIAVLDDEVLEKKVQSGETSILIARFEDGILLTAETPAIQELVARFADDQGFWGEPDSFQRIPAKRDGVN